MSKSDSSISYVSDVPIEELRKQWAAETKSYVKSSALRNATLLRPMNKLVGKRSSIRMKSADRKRKSIIRKANLQMALKKAMDTFMETVVSEVTKALKE